MADGTGMHYRCLMPPELLSANADAVAEGLPQCQAKAVQVGRGGGDSSRTAADVWGMGGFVFELATGRPAGGAQEGRVWSCIFLRSSQSTLYCTIGRATSTSGQQCVAKRHTCV